MADNQTQQAAEPTPEQQAEDKFWAQHEAKTRAVLDKWFEEKRKEVTDRTSTSRTGGRLSLGSILADLMFGPEKK